MPNYGGAKDMDPATAAEAQSGIQSPCNQLHNYKPGVVFVKFVGIHREYDAIDAKTVSMF